MDTWPCGFGSTGCARSAPHVRSQPYSVIRRNTWAAGGTGLPIKLEEKAECTPRSGHSIKPEESRFLTGQVFLPILLDGSIVKFHVKHNAQRVDVYLRFKLVYKNISENFRKKKICERKDFSESSMLLLSYVYRTILRHSCLNILFTFRPYFCFLLSPLTI